MDIYNPFWTAIDMELQILEHFWFTLHKSHPVSKYLSQEMFLEDCLLPSKFSQDAQSLNRDFHYLYTKNRSLFVLNNEQLPGAMAQAYLWLCICLSDHYFCSLAVSNPAGTNKSSGLKTFLQVIFSCHLSTAYFFPFLSFFKFFLNLFFVVKYTDFVCLFFF